jgi:predicted RecB family nuclease
MRYDQTSDLLQLPGVTHKREQRLRELGYLSLRDVAEADINELADDLEITKALAQQMIQTAQYLVRHD